MTSDEIEKCNLLTLIAIVLELLSQLKLSTKYTDSIQLNVLATSCFTDSDNRIESVILLNTYIYGRFSYTHHKR